MPETATAQERAYARTLHKAHALRGLAILLDQTGDLDAAIAQIDRADSLGAIVDPTLYRARATLMHEDRELLVAVRALARLGRPDATRRGRSA